MGFFYELAALGAKAEGAGSATNFGRAGVPLGTISPSTVAPVTPPSVTAQRAAAPAAGGALAPGAAGAAAQDTSQRSLLG